MHFDSNKVKDVLYVPGIRKNLVSVGKLTDVGLHILSTKRECVVFDSLKPSKVCLRGFRDPHNNL